MLLDEWRRVYAVGYLINQTLGGALVRALRARAGILLLINQRNSPPRVYLSGLILRNRLRWRAKLLRIFDRFLGLRDFGEI